MKHLRAFVATFFAIVGMLYLLGHCTACLPSDGELRAASYGSRLEACSRAASTLCESIECENRVRPQYGRPPRELPASCKDGGTP